MKKNYFSNKQTTTGLIALLFLFCGLCSQTVMAQETFTWTGASSTDWTDSSNWTQSQPLAGDDYPGQSLANATVTINPTAGSAASVKSGTYTITRLNVNNATGSEAGATLTIDSGATLNVNSSAVTNVVLAGGNIVNNGTLAITSTSTAASTGITCNIPPALPATATVYGYSGSGNLNINISASTTAASAAILVSSANALTTYSFLIKGTPIIQLGNATVSSFAVRSTNISPVIIGGDGFTIGSVGTPSNGALIGSGGSSNITVNSGTTLTMHSRATNATRQLSAFSSSATPITLTNKGTINILGETTITPLFFSCGASANSAIFNLNNEGTLNVDITVSSNNTGIVGNGNGGGTSTGVNTAFNINNTGTMTLKNNAITTGRGLAIAGISAGEAPAVKITNDGTLTLTGSATNVGIKTTLINNNVINSNNDFMSFTSITNSATGTYNFSATANTGTNKQAVYTVLSAAVASPGATYSDGTNTVTVTNQKYNFGTQLFSQVIGSAVLPTSGTLTKVTGTGDATIAFTGVTAPLTNAAFTSAITNNGTINTASESALGVMASAATSPTSVIAPGGATNKGIVNLYRTGSAVVLGKLILQVAGNAAAGSDFDQVVNNFTNGGITISGATLDVTGISGTATPVDILQANGTGIITGEFASVVGLTSGWSVNYGVAGKVQLVYEPPLGTEQFSDAKFSYYPNPTRNQLNISATKNISKVALFNLLGQKVQSYTVNANQKQLDMANLQNGVYLMEVTIENKKQSFRVVKQ